MSSTHGHRHHHKAVQRVETRLGVTTEFKDLSLHSAAANGNLGLVKFALVNGQPVNSVLNGLLPLHAAASSGNEAVVNLLIEYGADVNCRRLPRKYTTDKSSLGPAIGTSGLTPLHFAAANGHESVIKILLLNGANPFATEKYGHTPQHLASQAGHHSAANLLRNWKGADGNDHDVDDGASSSGASFHSVLKKSIHPKRSLDTLAFQLSHHAANSNLHFPTSSSSSARKGSTTSQNPEPPHRRPSLPSVFSRNSHGGASLRATLTSASHRRGSEPPRFDGRALASQSSLGSYRGTMGDESPTFPSGESVMEGDSELSSSWASRPRSGVYVRPTRSGSTFSREYPTSAPPTKTSFEPSDLATPIARATAPVRSRSTTSNTTTSSYHHTYYRPRLSSGLSGKSITSPLTGPSSPQVFHEDEDEERGDGGLPALAETKIEGVNIQDSSYAQGRQRSSSGASSSVPSSRPSSVNPATPADSEGTGTPDDRKASPILGLGLPRFQGRDRNNSVGSSTSSHTRPSSLFPKGTPANRSASGDPGDPSRRYESRSMRSNSVGTDGRFSSSSPASSYSGPGTLSTYAASNSTLASSVAPASLSSPGGTGVGRQSLLAPLYETTGTSPASSIANGALKPVATSPVPGSASDQFRWEVVQSAAAGDTSKPSKAATVPPPAVTKAPKAVDESKTSPPPQWLAVPPTNRLTSSSSPSGRRSVSPAGNITIVKASKPTPPSSTTTNPAHDTKATVEKASVLPKDLAPPPPSPAFAAPPRASSPASSQSSSAANGISYVPVVPSSSTKPSTKHTKTRSGPPGALGGGGPRSDRSLSQKGGSVTSTKDQTLLDAAEQARIAASVPKAEITAPKHKSWSKRLVSSVRGF